MSYAQEAEEIQRQMADIRCNLNEQVGEIVQSAKVMSDWQYYVRTYPWICVGAAAALGYLVVPARLEVISPDAKTLAKLAKQNRLLVKPEPEPYKRGGLMGGMFTLLAGALFRSLMAYAGQSLGKLVSPEPGARHAGPGGS